MEIISWNYVIVYRFFVLVKNTWNHITVQIICII